MTENPYAAGNSDGLYEKPPVDDPRSYERSILWHGAAWFFLVLTGYYILRPIREQISATYGIKNLSWLFSATFVAMLVAIPAYSLWVSTVHRRKLVPRVYAFFIASLVGFWASMEFGPAEWKIWIARILYIWISVYGLFIVSFFWSVVGDMLSTEQGRRVSGYIFGFGTIGGLVGSQIARRCVDYLGVGKLLLIPAALLIASLFVYMSLERSFASYATDSDVSKSSGKPTGGNPFDGFTAVFRSKYLFAIGCFGLFLATCGTTVYFQQSEIVEATFKTEAAKTEYFADINFYVSLVTLVLQFVVAGLLLKHVGLGWTLAVLPIAYVCGITALAFSPTISVLAVISVVGRAVEYGICNPAREVLFTSVDREDRYKAKSFIDTVVRRGGDSMVGTLYRVLRTNIGLALATMSWLVVPIAIAWAGLALFIGRENTKVLKETEGVES